MPAGRRTTTTARLHQALVNPVYAKKYSVAGLAGQRAQRALALKCLHAISGGSQADMDHLLQDLASAKPTAVRAEQGMVKKACEIFENIHADRNPSLNAARRAVLKVILASPHAASCKGARRHGACRDGIREEAFR